MLEKVLNSKKNKTERFIKDENLLTGSKNGEQKMKWWGYLLVSGVVLFIGGVIAKFLLCRFYGILC